MMVRLAALTVALLVTTAHAQDRPDLSGSWKLNADLTTSTGQNPASTRSTFDGRRSPIGGGPGGLGGVGRSPGATGAYGSGGADPEDAAKAREAVRLAMLTPEQLTIVREGNGFRVTDGDAAFERWSPSGKAVKSEEGALTVETRVKWDGSELVVERKFEGGVKATDRYAVTTSPRQLVIISKIENKTIRGERDRTFKRVYDSQ